MKFPPLQQSVVLDGEIVCLGGKGRSLFYELLFGRGEHGFIGDHVQVRGGKYRDCLGEVVGMSLTASAPTFTIEFEDGNDAEIAEGLPSKGT